MTFHSWQHNTAPVNSQAWAKAGDWWAGYPHSDGMGLIFEGPTGVGKTHLAAAIANELICEKGVDVRFFKYGEFMSELFESFSWESKLSTKAIISPMLEAEVAVVDGVEGPSLSPQLQNSFVRILSHRSSYRLPTIITTSCLDSPDTLLELGVIDTSNPEHQALRKEVKKQSAMTLETHLGVRARSILLETTEVCLMWGSSYRPLKHR